MKIKQAASYQDQVRILKSKGLIIEDKNDCMQFLKHTNYYRFSAYCESFRYEGKGRFIEGTTFDQIRNVYMFDQKLRAWLFEVVEEIEFALRTQISYHHGTKYGPDGYLDPNNFSRYHDGRNFQHHLRTILRENKDSPVVKHHNDKYDGKYPLWVIIEFFSMGMLSRFFKDMYNEDKNIIANLYSTTGACLENWIQCVTTNRNRCAHYSRFYDWEFADYPVFTEKALPRENTKVWGHLLVLRNMYPNEYEWNTELVPRLEDIINRYKDDIKFEHLGLPQNWNEWLIK